MASGSGKGSRQVIPYNSATKTTIPRTSYTVDTLKRKPVEQSRAYEKTTRVKYEDKQSGSYERYSRKEKASTGEPHVEKATGQVGVKDEFTRRSTVKIGDKSGYTLYEREERFRNVNFGCTNGTNNREIGIDNGNYDVGDYSNDDYDNGGGFDAARDYDDGYNNDDDY